MSRGEAFAHTQLFVYRCNMVQSKNSLQPSLANPVPIRRGRCASPLRRDALGLVVFFVLTLVMTNPLVLHIANAVEDKQDGLLNVWIVAWVGHALVTDPLNLFNANIFYPYPNTLAYSETLLPQGLFALPFNLAFDNTVLGYNLVLLASFFLAAYAMYLFVFDLTRNRSAGVIAGIIFAFNPYNLGNLAQVQLLSFGWMPLVLMYLRRLLNSKFKFLNSKLRITNYELRICILFSLFFSLQSLSSFYYAFLAGFAVAIYILWDFIIHRPRLSALVRVLISGCIIAIIVVPFFIPYLQVQQQMGFERKVTESEPFSASLGLYAQVSPQNVLYGNLLAPRPQIMIGGYPLDNLFPGIIAVVLAIIGVVASKERERWFYCFLFAFAFLLSLGPRLYLAPNNATDLTLPYRWLYDVFPLMKALRAPVRFDAVVMFGLAILAAFGLVAIQNSKFVIQNSTRELRFLNYELRFSFYVLLVPLIAFEYLAFPAANITTIPVWNEIPEYVRWLRAQPPGVVLELPMIASDPTQPLDLTTQYYSTYHWHSTPDGYSGFNPGKRGEIAYEMQPFPNERSISLLQALNVQYVVTPTSIQGGELVQKFKNDFIYRISPRMQDASQLRAQLYLPNPAAPNQNYFAYVIIQNHGQSSFASKPTNVLQINSRWNNDETPSHPVSLPLVMSRASVIPIRLTAPPIPGTYRLKLSASSPTIETWNLEGDVLVQEGEPAHEIVIPATVSMQSMLQPRYSPGDHLIVDLVWTPFNKTDAYYSASVRVVDTKGNKIVAQDREPQVSTFLWQPNVPIQDKFTLKLPNELVPGNYSIQVMMYQADQGTDALLLDWEFKPRQVIDLATFTVK